MSTLTGQATGTNRLLCRDDERRAALAEHDTLNGIDYLEVITTPPADNQRLLAVHLIAKTTAAGQANRSALLDTLAADPGRFAITGGVRLRDPQVLAVQRVGDHLEVRLEEPGDFSTYTLSIDYLWTAATDGTPRLDPAFARIDFSFKAGCPSRFDCAPERLCPEDLPPPPRIDYLAKDYASFRQLLLDQLAARGVAGSDGHPADLMTALVEVLAYTGDQLSYLQDAVANEAWLATARQRISVRRHARLIDYRMHDGASARAFVHFAVAAGTPASVAKGTRLLSRVTVPLRGVRPPHGPFLDSLDAEAAMDAAHVVFETLADAELHGDLSTIALHPWGDRRCCLPRGATSVDLVGDLAGLLASGDWLLLEEIAGPETGLAADADPRHRQVVRLVAVEATRDPLEGVDLTRVAWADDDALTFPLCVSSVTSDGAFVSPISVARGNLVLADHGRRFEAEPHAGPLADVPPRQRRPHRFLLDHGPLSFRVPLPDDPLTPAAALQAADPHSAEPQVVRLVVAGSLPDDDWRPISPDLLRDSGPADHHVAVETDNTGRALLRFGDGDYGQPPSDNAAITVTYRVGVGSGGNVGHEALVHVIEPEPVDGGAPALTGGMLNGVRNPLPAWGGIDPESIEAVKRWAPAAFHAEQFRAVTEADYAAAAMQHPRVQQAAATFRWTGSWHTVFVTIDPVGQVEVDPALEDSVRAWVTRFKQAGYDLEIDPPQYRPLEIELRVCVDRQHFRAHVEAAVLDALSSRALPRGGTGFFHPDRFTLGQPLYLSRLVAAVEAVEGVDSVEVLRFRRLDEADPNPLRPATERNLLAGAIPVGRLGVIRLDNDPSFPEHGVLELRMAGGK